MHIRNITFSGFKSKVRHAKVDFSESNVTVIYGDNGCGKTTFLKALTAFLSQDEITLKSLGIYNIHCEIIDGDEIRFIDVSYQDNGYNWPEPNISPLSMSTSLSLGIERGLSTQSVKIEPELIIDFFARTPRYINLISDNAPGSGNRKAIYDLAEDLSEFIRKRNYSIRNRHRTPEIDWDKKHIYIQSIKIENIEDLLLQKYRIARYMATRKIQSALFDTLSVAIDIEHGPQPDQKVDKDLLQHRLKENKDRIIEALDDGEENNFKTRLVEILKRIDEPEELNKIRNHSLLSQLLDNMINELDEEKLVLSSINHLVERFNSYLIDNKKLVVNGRECYILIDGDNHSLNELSSGERHILTFLGLVLFVGQGRDFLIIDEPEISLNINWQRELMSIFSSLLPWTQIIVASHSPAIAKRNPDYLRELQVWKEL